MQFVSYIAAMPKIFRPALAGAFAAILMQASVQSAAAVPFAPAPQSEFSLFQASSIRFSTQKLASLTELVKKDSGADICVTARHRNCALWTAVVNHLSDADLHTRVRWINYAVNRLISYKADRSVEDDWRVSLETLQSMAGDCEDYALLKMKLLSAMGVPASRMAVVVVSGAWANMHHAVLAVNLDGKVWILDNLREDVAVDTSIRGYRPLYAFNSEGSWLYGTSARN